MNTQTNQPDHGTFASMAMGRQLEQQRRALWRATRRELERRYTQALIQMVQQASLPRGCIRRTWTVNQGVIYIGVQRLENGRGEGRQVGQRRCEWVSETSVRRRGSTDAPTSFAWIEVGPVPDPRGFQRASANEAVFGQPYRLAA